MSPVKWFFIVLLVVLALVWALLGLSFPGCEMVQDCPVNYDQGD